MRHRKAFPRLAIALILLLMLNGHSPAIGQSVGNYVVTRTTGNTYNSVYNSGVPCNSWRYTGAFQQDDNRSYPVPIGFDFWYDGVMHDEVNISTNGYIDFSTSTANGGPTGAAYGYVNAVFSQANGTSNAIAPMYDDMTTQGASDPLGTSIRTLLSGTAPNRVFTIEWDTMAVYLNTTPNLNFQVKLYETSGIIEFNYGTMTQGTANFSYSCGINAPTVSNVPTVAQLKCQQMANTATFSNGVQNNLTALPQAGSRIRFTPPAPLNPGSTLTFTGVTQTQMTLNWTNWATNEVGYVLYNSIDNINFDFVTQTAANATSTTITGLYSSTTYYWRLYAVTEGTLSNAVLGSQATSPGTTFISVTSGNWGTAGTWNVNAVPGATDNVIITSSHTVTINVTNAACHNLTVGQGGAAVLRIGSNNTARTLTVGGNISVGIGATLTVNTASNTTHSLVLSGNLTNNGTVDFQADGNSLCDVSFIHPTLNQTLNGSGVTNRYNAITVDKGTSTSRILNVSTSTFNPMPGFLTILNGCFKLSTTGAVSVTPWIADADIPLHGKFWLNSASATVTTTGGNINLYGELLISNGTMTIGNAANNCLVYYGGLLTMNGGNLNIASRIDRVSTTVLSRFAISAGTITVNKIGSTSTTNAPFMMDVAGSQFTQTGGLIIIERKGGTTQDLGFICTGGILGTVTGGFLQMGDAATPVAQTMQVNTVSPVGGFRVASANATAQLVTNGLKVITDVQLQSGIFNANNLSVSLGGNWSNTGGTYTAGTNTTTFNGSTAQSITRSAGAENFNNLSFTGAGLKTLGSAINARNISISTGASFSVGSPGYTINLSGNWTKNGSFFCGTNGLINCIGTTSQTLGGSVVTTWRNLTIQNTAGVSTATDQYLLGTLLLNSGTFTTTGHYFTLVSNTAGTARIGKITGGNIVGEINMQRYIFLGPTGWRQMCAPVNGRTFADWNDELITTGFPGSDYPTFSFSSIEWYNEAALGPKQIGYLYPTDVTNPIVPNKGYFVYVGPLSVLMDVKGTPRTMNQTFTLTYTPSAGPANDGWNLVGNPYPSSIDWDAAGWTRTNTDQTLYIWNSALNQYSTYVSGVGTNGGSKNIASCQAFWVRATAANPSMTITENVKTAVDPAYLHATQSNSVSDLLSLTILNGDTSMTDQTIVHFDASATDTFDVGFDAMKMGSMDTLMPYLATLQNDLHELSIDTRSTLSNDITIPLRCTVGVSGNYIIRRDTSSSLANSVCVTLEDLYTNTLTSLSQGAAYSFTISDTTNTPRFLLHFGPSLTLGSQVSSCSYSSDGKAFAKGTGNGPWDYVWKDLSGNVIATHPMVSGTDTLFGTVPGIYIVEVNGNNGYCDFRADTVVVEGPDPMYVSGSAIPPVCSYTTDGSIHIAGVAGGTSPYSLLWPDGSSLDSLVNLIAGNYSLIVLDGHNCLDTFAFDLSSSSLLNASFLANPDTITVQNIVAFSNYSTAGIDFQWDFGDGVGTDTDPNPFYTYNTAGNFSVTLIASDSICYDTATVVITVLTDLASIRPVDIMQGVAVIPGNESIGILFDLPQSEDVMVTIIDPSGKTIAEEKENMGIGRMDIPVQIADGVYLVRIEREGKTVTRKIVMLRR